MKHPNAPNPNDARADRALAALSTTGAGESDVITAAARMLTDLSHLCHRQRIAISAVTKQAGDTYRLEVEQHGPARPDSHNAGVIEPEPIEVVALTRRGTVVYRSSAGEICGEFLDDPDILVPLWNLLVEALLDGKASEDPGDIPQRTFQVEAVQRSALARQLLELRSEVASAGAVDPAKLDLPEGGLEQFLD